MSMGTRSKMDEPCAVYFGNVCTGFGDDDQTCLMCGWQRGEHPEESQQMLDLLASLRQTQAIAEVLEVVNHEQ